MSISRQTNSGPVLAALVILSLAAPAYANQNRVPSVGPTGCNQCHINGMAPTVTVSQTSAPGVLPMELTVSVSQTNGTKAGFMLTKSNGTLSNPGQGAKLLS